MEKELLFDKSKYIKISLLKLSVVIIMVFLFILVNTLFRGIKFTPSDYAVMLLFVVFIDCCYACRLYLNYRFYKNDYQCVFTKDFLAYTIVRCPNLLESAFKLFSNYTAIYLEVNRIDKIEKKFGRIIIYGKMTVEKVSNKSKIKILNKYKLYDYFQNEEELIEYTK